MMFIVREDDRKCALCKYWNGNANLEFVFGHKIKINDNVLGYCRKRQVQILAMYSCPNFDRKADYCN